ncbi:MAG: T9SS type A sorting domain-containing protein [Bacteroidota bacterium]
MKRRIRFSLFMMIFSVKIAFSQACPSFLSFFVTDNTNCDPSDPNGALLIDGFIDLDGNFIADVSGYTITLFLGTSPDPTDQIGTGDQYFGLESGDYSVVMKDINGVCGDFFQQIFIGDDQTFFYEEIETKICFGESYLLGTQTLTSSGEFTEVFQSQEGCDSTVVLTLTVQPTFNERASVGICEGESYAFGSQTLTSSGDFMEVFQSQAACDSTVALTLAVHPTFNEHASVAICEGGSYAFGGQMLTTSGDFTEVFTSQSSCDSTVTLTLAVHPTFNERTSVAICEGGSYAFGDQTLTTSGDFMEVFTSQSGCDSTVTLTLAVHPTFNEATSVAICEGERYAFGNQTLTTSGDYTEIFQSQSGCDSTVVLSLLIEDCIVSALAGDLEEGFKIFPNPTKEVVNVTFGRPLTGKIKLINLSGHVLIEEFVNLHKATLDLTNLPNGIYIIYITGIDGATILEKTIIKE